jgi:hypothetical protein
VQLKEQMKATSPENVKINKQELDDWEKELVRVQNLLPFEGAWNKITLTEMPALRKKIEDQTEEIPAIADAAQDVSYLFRLSIVELNIGSRLLRA